MDKIKKILAISLFMMMFVIANGQSVYKDDYVKILVNKNWTLDSMNVIKKKMKTKYNIDISFSNAKFDKNKKLKSVLVKANDNTSYSGSSDYNGMLKEYDFVILRDYGWFARTQFIIGYVEK